MSGDRIEGAAKTGVGRVESAVGEFVGDDRVHVKGKVLQAEGSAQGAFGKAKDRLQELLRQARTESKPVISEIEKRLRDRPFTAISIGLVLGWLLRGGPKKVYIRR